MIPGIDSTVVRDLGQAVRRDPDALPPRNVVEVIVDRLYRMVASLSYGNALFAIKAGVLTGQRFPRLRAFWTTLPLVILTLPILLKSSVGFAYGMWNYTELSCPSDSVNRKQACMGNVRKLCT